MTARSVLDRPSASRAATVRVDGEVSGAGAGSVEVVVRAGTVTLVEAGTWALDGGRPIRWRSSSTWRVEGGRLAVEHARRGEPARATLEAGPDGVWRGARAWVCGPDAYAVELAVLEGAVEVAWTARGPSKNARTATRYA